MGFLASLLTKLAIGLTSWLAARHDLKKSARQALEIHAAKLATQAEAWKARDAVRPDGGNSTLGVRDGARPIDLPGDPPRA